MSNGNKTSWDQFSEHGATGCIVVIALFLAIFMPWIIILYVVGFAIWAALKIAEYRQERDKRNNLP